MALLYYRHLLQIVTYCHLLVSNMNGLADGVNRSRLHVSVPSS